ncbi:MAG: LysR family transcriptional regulator [Rhodobacteraceae bacterium]|nr:LysR family transcriptional regulator [Paracoccaceae bacterium]
MTRHLPPLNWFRVFEAAARHQKFTAAADELGMTQSAVSQQIRALEERLATQLFLRQPRGLLLTDAGRKLLPKVSSSIENLKNAIAKPLIAKGQLIQIDPQRSRQAKDTF